jgi:hypothetical protein
LNDHQNPAYTASVMGEVHQLVLRHGIDTARAMVETRAERQAVDAAAAIMAEEANRIGITHAGFAMTSLPHRRIEEGSPAASGQGRQRGQTRRRILQLSSMASRCSTLICRAQWEAQKRRGMPAVEGLVIGLPGEPVASGIARKVYQGSAAFCCEGIFS